MADHKIVGTSVPRGEGGGKVSGQTVYAADVKLPGLLWAKILRSPHPHARVRRVDISRAEKVPGVCAIITGADVEGFLIGKQIRDILRAVAGGFRSARSDGADCAKAS
jgi:CO/xanthine dehydrogenase Mo-binding subunit